MAVLTVAFLPQVRRDVGKIERKGRTSFGDSDGTTDVDQRVGRICGRLAAGDAPVHNGVRKLEVALSGGQFGLCGDRGRVRGTTIVIEEGAHQGIAVYREITRPRSLRDCSAASNRRTTRKPATPSFEGVLPV